MLQHERSPAAMSPSFPSQGRPGHRRSYSSISYDAASPALAHIPRRRPASAAVHGPGPDDSPRKPTFQLGRDDDDDSSGDDAMTSNHIHADDDRALPPLRLKPKLSPFDAAHQRASPPPQLFLQPPTAVPFPRSSPSPSPSHSYLPFPQSQPDAAAKSPDPRLARPSFSRTSSHPIMLANGKPLKSSLKGSSSSPNIPFPPQSLVPSIMFPDLHKHSSYHHRTRSAPSTPLLQNVQLATSSSSSSSDSTALRSPSPPSPILFPQKNVHFPSQEEGGLATVRVFNRSAKPASLSRLGEETETETEGESSASGWGALRGNTWGPRTASAKANPRHFTTHSPLGRDSDKFLSIDVANSTPVPARGAERGDGNVYLESIGFDLESPQGPVPKRPLVLIGTMLVRNVTYQKTVAIRFTLDEWHTTNDVVALHNKSLRALPARFVRGASGALDAGTERVCSPLAVDAPGDDNALINGGVPAWDRFRFQINLEDYADALESRTMWLVGRYSAGAMQGPGAPSGPTDAPGALPPAEWWDNNMGANYRVAFVRKEREVLEGNGPMQLPRRGVIVSAPSVYAPAVRPAAASPPPKSYPAPPQMSASISLPLPYTEQQKSNAYAEQKQHQAAMTQSTLARLKKLNLLNYAAPTSTAFSPTSPRASALSVASLDSSTSSATSAESTPLLTPTQADADADYLHKEGAQDVDVDVLHDASGALHAGSARPGWGAASTPIAVGRMSMGMENGFPATFLAPEPTSASTGDETLPTPASVSALSPEMGTSPPFSSLADMALGGSGKRTGGGASFSWPWSAFGAGEDASTPVPVPTHVPVASEEKAAEKDDDKEEEEEMKTAPLSAPVASLLSDIRARSIGSGSGFGSGAGQIAPPQRRKGAHARAASDVQTGGPRFMVGGSSYSPSSSGSESGSPSGSGSGSGSGKVRRAGAGSTTPSGSPSTPTPTWGFRPASPRPAPSSSSSATGTASPPYPGSPKRYLSPLPSYIGEPVFAYAGPAVDAGMGVGSGARSPTRVGARSPLRLSPVNSSDDIGLAGAGTGAGAGMAGDASGAGASGGGGGQPQDDAVYQAFVRQWCFAQAPGPTVGASVGGSGSAGSRDAGVVPGPKSINV